MWIQKSLYKQLLKGVHCCVTQTTRDRLLELATQGCVWNTFHTSLTGCPGRGRHLYTATSCHQGGKFYTSETWLNAHYTSQAVLGSQCQSTWTWSSASVTSMGIVILLADVSSSNHVLSASPSPLLFLSTAHTVSVHLSVLWLKHFPLIYIQLTVLEAVPNLMFSSCSLMSYLCFPRLFYASWFSTSLLRVVF